MYPSSTKVYLANFNTFVPIFHKYSTVANDRKSYREVKRIINLSVKGCVLTAIYFKISTQPTQLLQQQYKKYIESIKAIEPVGMWWMIENNQQFRALCAEQGLSFTEHWE